MSAEVLLYTTLGCHLCEQAEQLLQALPDCQWQAVEISDDPALVERYGLRIPVVYRQGASQDLGWPFDAAALQAYLAAAA